MSTLKFGAPIEYTNDFSLITGPNVVATQSYITNNITNIINNSTSGNVNFASTAGWAYDSAHAYNASNLNNQAASFYLDRTNHTGTQLSSTISDFASAVNSLNSGTSGWATNSANSYLLNNQAASYYSGFILDDQSTTPLMSFKINNDYKGPGQITLTNGTSNITGVNTVFTDATVGTGFSYWFGFLLKDSANNWYRIYVQTVTNDTSATISSHYSRTDTRNGFTTSSGATFTGVTGTYDYYFVKNISDGIFSNALGNNSYADFYGVALGGSTVAIGGFAYGLNSVATGNQSVSLGNYVRASGNQSFAGGKGFGLVNNKTPLASGQTSFAFYEANTSQTTGHGALAANSAILGGINPNIPTDSPRSVILGGNSIKARAATADMVYVPSLNIATTPNAGTSGSNLEFLLRYNSGATGDVAKLSIGAGFNVAGGTISVTSVSNADTSGFAQNAANAFLLQSQNGAYYLNRTNHTGTQLSSTISDFNNATNFLINSGTAGYAFNASSAYTASTLNNQAPSYYLSRFNHTDTQPVSTISDLATNGTAGVALVALTAYNSSFTATNGLTKTGNNVTLGGSLTQSTTLVLGENDLTINAASTSGHGLKYAADYSANYTSRSIVDKAYVDTHFTAGNTARTIGVSIDGNGQVISAGIKGYIVAGFTGTITGWDIVADQVGTITFDVWKGTGSVPTVANTITGSQQPNLASTQYNSSTNVSTWSTSVTLGDILVFNVNGATLVTKATLSVRMIQ